MRDARFCSISENQKELIYCNTNANTESLSNRHYIDNLSDTKLSYKNYKSNREFVKSFANKHNSISKMMDDVLRKKREENEISELREKVHRFKLMLPICKQIRKTNILPPLEKTNNEEKCHLNKEREESCPAKKIKCPIFQTILSPTIIPPYNKFESIDFKNKLLILNFGRKCSQIKGNIVLK